jgi:hypothetical protein
MQDEQGYREGIIQTVTVPGRDTTRLCRKRRALRLASAIPTVATHAV